MSSSGDMKSLLTASLALIAAAAPSLAQVGSVIPSTEPLTQTSGAKVFWLVMRIQDGGLFAIPTASRDQCEMSGAEYASSKRIMKDTHTTYRGFDCLEGIR